MKDVAGSAESCEEYFSYDEVFPDGHIRRKSFGHCLLRPYLLTAPQPLQIRKWQPRIHLMSRSQLMMDIQQGKFLPHYSLALQSTPLYYYIMQIRKRHARKASLQGSYQSTIKGITFKFQICNYV